LGLEHATKIVGIIRDRWGADKYKQVFSKPLGARFVYLCTFCAKSLYIPNPFGCAQSRWEDNVKTDLQGSGMWGYGLDWAGSG
jgi:hypothetical protein